MIDQAPPIAVVALGATVLLVSGLLALLISRRLAWGPAGPLALIAAAPVVPRIPLLFSLTLDDLTPLLGLGMLALQLPFPRLTSDRIFRIVLFAVALATIARVGSALVNGGSAEGAIVMFAKAVARPVLLVGVVSYAAIAMPPSLRRRYVATFVAVVGTFEAVFGVIAFAVPLPDGAGLEAARRLTTLYGVCPGRISGTLGLSPNHIGAVFVVTIAVTIGLAVVESGWRRWGWGLATAVQMAALVLTFTRSSIILGTIVALVLLISYRRLVLLLGVAAISAVLVLATLTAGCTTASGGHGLPTNPGSLISGRFGDSNDRLALWYAAGRILLDHPVFGVGLGQMDATLHEDPARYMDTPFGPATSSAHNTILLAGAETGFLGALAAVLINLGLGLTALRIAWRGWKRSEPLLVAAAFAIAGYLVQGMVNNLFEVGATSVLFALTIGAFAVRDPAGP
jgi:O-antigen ligase